MQSTLAERLGAEDIHIGPSDYIPWLNDNKLCFLRIEGSLFGDVPMNLELRLSVEDSPNSARRWWSTRSAAARSRSSAASAAC